MIDDAGKPLKFLDVGSSAHGVIAIGAVARGVVAIGGAVSVGVVSIGVNACGTVLAIGVNAVAPVTIALANGAGVVAFVGANGLGAFGGAGANAGFTPVLALVFAVVLCSIAAALPRRAPVPVARETMPFAEIAGGGASDGWVLAHNQGPSEAGVALRIDGQRVELAADKPVRDDAELTPGGVRVHAHLVAETRVTSVEGDYRAAPLEERALRCVALEPAPRHVRLSTVHRWTLVASGFAALAAGALALIAQTTRR